ncbi:MAG: thioredoxin family protein [Ancrocorticia sp.]|uniref:thioredoxin family protein n=1 Tax=Ancrocorticia sp. TaxID=2593684 RepID=UPI003F9092BE
MVVTIMKVDLFSSSFCGPCHRAASVLDQASGLVSELRVSEHNVAMEPALAEAEAIRSTPTTIVRTDEGDEVFRSEGVPTLDQLLRSLALATDA